MSLKLPKPLVSASWLLSHLNDKNLIVLDCTIPKVTAKKTLIEQKKQIKGALFFDIKNVFSDINAPFPNTALSPQEFELKAQELGINKSSIIVCYDDLGVYSSPRVWWLFQLMGFKNIAVLNGGLPKWKEEKFPIENQQKNNLSKGNFKVDYQPQKITYTKEVLSSLEDKNILIADARSKGRFYTTEPEPRKEVKGGHIPNSVSFPFGNILKDGLVKPKEDLLKIYKELNPDEKELVFTCGTGITASILALGAAITNQKSFAVYDGSWTEWGSTEGLPIEI